MCKKAIKDSTSWTRGAHPQLLSLTDWRWFNPPCSVSWPSTTCEMRKESASESNCVSTLNTQANKGECKRYIRIGQHWTWKDVHVRYNNWLLLRDGRTWGEGCSTSGVLDSANFNNENSESLTKVRCQEFIVGIIFNEIKVGSTQRDQATPWVSHGSSTLSRFSLRCYYSHASGAAMLSKSALQQGQKIDVPPTWNVREHEKLLPPVAS